MLNVEATIRFEELPALVSDQESSKVEGHALQWLIGKIGGDPVHLLAGRRHYYEGIEIQQSAMAVRLMALVGVRLVVLTNASGGLHPRLHAGDLMLIRDQTNLMFRNPLVGPDRERFVAVLPDCSAASDFSPGAMDMSEPYDPAASAMIRRAAEAEKIPLQEGIYAAVAGPNFETPAEVEFLRRLGADAVGMSTVPDVIVARHAGLRVVGISAITNSHIHGRKSDVEEDVALAAPATHEEVLRVGAEIQDRLARLLAKALPGLYRLSAISAG